MNVRKYVLNDAILGVVEQLDRKSVATIYALSKVIDNIDKFSAGHSYRVMQYSEILGKRLFLSAEEIEKLKISALLHDIGKLGLSAYILNKQSTLSVREYSILKTHSKIGRKILKKIKGFKDIVPAVYQHHEQFNGKGYPKKIKGRAVNLHARIISIADAYDAMTSNRSYRRAFPAEKALDEISKNKNIQFDPLIAEIFIHYIEDDLIDITYIKGCVD
jgi:putative nucleotidyltransferase with HDIG domain